MTFNSVLSLRSQVYRLMHRCRSVFILMFLYMNSVCVWLWPLRLGPYGINFSASARLDGGGGGGGGIPLKRHASLAVSIRSSG